MHVISQYSKSHYHVSDCEFLHSERAQQRSGNIVLMEPLLLLHYNLSFVDLSSRDYTDCIELSVDSVQGSERLRLFKNLHSRDSSSGDKAEELDAASLTYHHV